MTTRHEQLARDPAAVVGWEPRRLAAVAPDLPAGAAPPGTRGRILQAALGLYSEYGFHGTSIRQIARQVGINPATLYAHYPSKEQILADLVWLGHQELYDRLCGALASAGRAASARLAAIVREHALIHTDYPLLAVVANAELHVLSAEHAAAALDLRARCRKLLADVLAEGARTGEFRLVDPTLTAIAIGGLSMQIAHWFAPGTRYAPDQVADAYAQLALRMAGDTTALTEANS
ncbi:MAG TPA: TetR/AcrR family transcriptional regulator [Streptosporangiaceae bacterium]|nr:TetR/AcrR family transcriptional regulator [Streptosporangiaceae bacterium]